MEIEEDNKEANDDRRGIWLPQCRLCEHSLYSTCMICTVDRQWDCAVKLGECCCTFHTHCINSWLRANIMCPTPRCGKRWVTVAQTNPMAPPVPPSRDGQGYDDADDRHIRRPDAENV
jgi:hypothetical protein